jgi:hypothetical protein
MRANGRAPVDDIEIASWNELSNRLHALAWNPALNRLRSNYVYRGMPARGHPLATRG